MTADLRKKLLDALEKDQGASSDFDLNPSVVLPENRSLKPAAVLIGIRADTETVILTKRSAKLKHHPGQIAFPGGKKDAQDVDLIATAKREANEEIGLPAEVIEVLGPLVEHETVTGFQVQPIVTLIKEKFDFFPEAGEVSEVFEVPLDHLLNTENYRIESRRWQGQRRYFYVVPFGPYYIWGATARILFGLANRT